MTPPKTKRREDLLDNTAFLITDIARLYRTHFDGRMKALGLDRSEWWLVAYLVYFNGATQQALTELTDLSKGGMGKLIDRMEARGLVRRESSRDDRRINRILLTEAGWTVGAEVDAQAVKATKNAVAPLTDDECRTLNALLARMRAANLDDDDPGPAAGRTLS